MTNTYSTKVRTFSQLSSRIYSYNPNTQGRRMLAEIITEGNLIQHHPVINAAGMEQMQSPILAPYGQAQMTHVESFLLGNKCQDIAISDAREFLAATSCQTGGYISHVSAAVLLLILFHTQGLSPILCNGRIGIPMCTHIMQIQFLCTREGEPSVTFLTRNLAHQTHGLCRGYPLAEVMAAAGISVHMSIDIAYGGKPMTEITPSGSIMTGGEHQSNHCLHECSAIHLAQIYGQLFTAVLTLKGMCHIGDVQKLIGIMEYKR